MPATDKTRYNIKRLHVIFAVSGLILLVSTLWMLKADHQREWKQYQRKARTIDLRMTDWRQLQQQTEAISNARQQIEERLTKARGASLDASLLEEFYLLSKQQLTEPSEAKLSAAIAAAKQAEAILLGKLKFRRADLDKAKADLGLAIRDGLSQDRQAQLQVEIDVVQVDVDAKTVDYDKSKDTRQNLQRLFAELMKEVRELEKQRDDSKAEENRLMASIQDRQSKWFEGTWLGKRWLELPILDAFNSPLTIENLWSEDLEQDYNHRMVRRFDRCTTCHQSMEKTMPGSATEGIYLRQRVVQLRLSAPTLVALQAAEAGTAPPATEPAEDAEPSAKVSATKQLLDVYGIQLAEEGLLERGEVTVQFVEPRTLGAKAEALADIPVGEDQLAEDIVKSVLESPGLSKLDCLRRRISIRGRDSSWVTCSWRSTTIPLKQEGVPPVLASQLSCGCSTWPRKKNPSRSRSGAVCLTRFPRIHVWICLWDLSVLTQWLSSLVPFAMKGRGVRLHLNGLPIRLTPWVIGVTGCESTAGLTIIIGFIRCTLSGSRSRPA